MIVIFSPGDDRHALRVADLLGKAHGEETLILDLSDFPSRTALELRFEMTETCRLALAGGREIDLFAVKSFWWRRPQAPVPDLRIADDKVRHFAINESMSALFGALSCCNGLWINDMARDQEADYKPRQLQLARALGMTVPETLITSDPAAVRAFRKRMGGNVVYKAFNQRGIIWQPTRLLEDSDMDRLASLSCAPAIFQRIVSGHRDIRVTVVGETLFATEFDIGGANVIDHRLALGTAPCLPHILPPEIEAQALGFVRALGLEYGSLDFRLDDAGTYHFFEINTAGEFLYLQDRSGQPIDAAVAAHLAGGVPARAVVPKNFRRKKG